MSPHRAFAYTWASRLLAAAVVTLLMATVGLFLQVWDLQGRIAEGRHERNAFQADTNDKLCALLAAETLVPRGRYAELCSSH